MATLSETDERLVQRTRAGDAAAFVALVERHVRLVERLIARLVDDPSDREEVCQDVFVRVHRGLAQFRGESSLPVWIARIAHHTAINHLKRRQRGAVEVLVEPAVAEGVPSGELDPEEQLSASRRRAVVQREVQRLPHTQRTVLTLYHLQGMSIEEITEVLSLPPGTVKSHLFRARKRLKDQLLERLTVEDLRT